MNIKNLKPNKNARTKQGYFSIKESVKYIGKVKRVIYRSSWEQIFCTWCERSPQVKQWASESVEIKYLCPLTHNIRNYYPDYLVKLSTGNVWLVEVKPAKDCVPPTKPKRKTKKALANYEYSMKTFLVNDSKFKSARKFCETKGWTFFIADENWFKKKK